MKKAYLEIEITKAGKAIRNAEAAGLEFVGVPAFDEKGRLIQAGQTISQDGKFFIAEVNYEDKKVLDKLEKKKFFRWYPAKHKDGEPVMCIHCFMRQAQRWQMPDAEFEEEHNKQIN